MRKPRPGTVLGALALAAVLPVAAPASAETSVTVMRQIDTDRYDPHRSTSRATAEALFMVGDTLVSLDPDLKTRSEEHTSELQSLMRISYAVFCLKKKKKNIIKQRS